MNLKRSNVKRILKEGGICYGTMLRILKSPQAVALSASQHWDYIILDTEYNDYNMETLADISLAAKYEDMALFVRVPDKLHHQMAQMLDIGAEGLVLPQVKTQAEAEHIIRSTKYAPMGKRGCFVDYKERQGNRRSSKKNTQPPYQNIIHFFKKKCISCHSIYFYLVHDHRNTFLYELRFKLRSPPLYFSCLSG